MPVRAVSNCSRYPADWNRLSSLLPQSSVDRLVTRPCLRGLCLSQLRPAGSSAYGFRIELPDFSRPTVFREPTLWTLKHQLSRDRRELCSGQRVEAWHGRVEERPGRRNCNARDGQDEHRFSDFHMSRRPSNVVVRPSSLRKPIRPDEIWPSEAVVLVGVHHRPGVVQRTDKELGVVKFVEGHQRATAAVGRQ